MENLEPKDWPSFLLVAHTGSPLEVLHHQEKRSDEEEKYLRQTIQDHKNWLVGLILERDCMIWNSTHIMWKLKKKIYSFSSFESIYWKEMKK